MKTVGIIGGIAPESTIEYYRSIIASYREQKRDGSYPTILLNSIDLRKMLNFVDANELTKLTDYLAGEIYTSWLGPEQISACSLPIRRTSFSMRFAAYSVQ